MSITDALVSAVGKKFQNVAKEGLSLDGDSEGAKAARKEQAERFEPLVKWLGEDALKEHILKAEISERLASSPCALITSRSVFILHYVQQCCEAEIIYFRLRPFFLLLYLTPGPDTAPFLALYYHSKIN